MILFCQHPHPRYIVNANGSEYKLHISVTYDQLVSACKPATINYFQINFILESIHGVMDSVIIAAGVEGKEYLS